MHKLFYSPFQNLINAQKRAFIGRFKVNTTDVHPYIYLLFYFGS